MRCDWCTGSSANIRQLYDAQTHCYLYDTGPVSQADDDAWRLNDSRPDAIFVYALTKR